MSTALQWFKPDYSNEQGRACLEVATTLATIRIRDSKQSDNAPTLTVTPTTWTGFLALARC